jgi:hypothetical protein
MMLCLYACAEEDVSQAARALVGLVEAVDSSSRGWGATFILELFRGSPTARNKAMVGAAGLVAITPPVMLLSTWWRVTV